MLPPRLHHKLVFEGVCLSQGEAESLLKGEDIDPTSREVYSQYAMALKEDIVYAYNLGDFRRAYKMLVSYICVMRDANAQNESVLTSLYRMFHSLVEALSAQRHLNHGLRIILEGVAHSEDVRRKIKAEIDSVKRQFNNYRMDLMGLLSDDNCIHLAGTLPRIRVLLDDPIFQGDFVAEDGNIALRLVDILQEIDDLAECIQYAVSYDIHRNCPEVEYLLSSMKLEIESEGYKPSY
jgi:hypothetical protein